MANEEALIRATPNFHLIYTPEHMAALRLWEKNIAEYTIWFLKRHESHPRPDHVRSMLLSSVNYCSMQDVLRKLHATAIPIGVNYGQR